MTWIWVYDIKHTELLKPLSCTDANCSNPAEKCGMLFIKCRWVSFFSKPISRCLNLGAVTISGIFWTFLSSFLHWNLLCCVFEGSQSPTSNVEPGLFCSLCQVLFIYKSPLFPLISFMVISKWGKLSLEIQLLCLSIKQKQSQFLAQLCFWDANWSLIWISVVFHSYLEKIPSITN